MPVRDSGQRVVIRHDGRFLSAPCTEVPSVLLRGFFLQAEPIVPAGVDHAADRLPFPPNGSGPNPSIVQRKEAPFRGFLFLTVNWIFGAVGKSGFSRTSRKKMSRFTFGVRRDSIFG